MKRKYVTHSVNWMLGIGLIMVSACFSAALASNIDKRGAASLVAPPYLDEIIVNWHSHGQLYAKVYVATYAQPEDVKIILVLYNNFHSEIGRIQRDGATNQLTLIEGSDDGFSRGRFVFANNEQIFQHRLGFEIIHPMSELDIGRIDYVRVWMLNRNTCKLFGATDTRCHTRFSVFSPELGSKLGNNNSIRPGDPRKIYMR